MQPVRWGRGFVRLRGSPSGLDGAVNPLVDCRSRRHTAASSVLDIRPSTMFAVPRRRGTGEEAQGARVPSATGQKRARHSIGDSPLRQAKAVWCNSQRLRDPFAEPGILEFLVNLMTDASSGAELWNWPEVIKCLPRPAYWSEPARFADVHVHDIQSSRRLSPGSALSNR